MTILIFCVLASMTINTTAQPGTIPEPEPAAPIWYAIAADVVSVDEAGQHHQSPQGKPWRAFLLPWVKYTTQAAASLRRFPPSSREPCRGLFFTPTRAGAFIAGAVYYTILYIPIDPLYALYHIEANSGAKERSRKRWKPS